jgi:hypothetical protein
MTTPTGIFLLVILPLLLAEFSELAPWLAKQIVRLAVKVLPRDFQERLGTEWQGDVDRTPGKLWKLVPALGFLLWAHANRRAALGLPTVRDAVFCRVSECLTLGFDWAGQLARRLQARARRTRGQLGRRLRNYRDDRARPPPVVTLQNMQWAPRRA